MFEQKGKEFVKRKKLKLDSRAKVKKFEQEKVCWIVHDAEHTVLALPWIRMPASAIDIFGFYRHCHGMKVETMSEMACASS